MFWTCSRTCSMRSFSSSAQSAIFTPAAVAVTFALAVAAVKVVSLVSTAKLPAGVFPARP